MAVAASSTLLISLWFESSLLVVACYVFCISRDDVTDSLLRAICRLYTLKIDLILNDFVWK